MLRIRNPYIILGLLTTAYTLSFMDRYVLNLVLNNVKHDMQLSEMQAGLLAGAGFAVLYALMALPMGVIADKKRRTKLAAIGIGLWSAMTALCALSRNYVQLLLCRTGVGVGEAALTPAAYPIIKSLFPSSRLSTAIGVYCSGIYIGSGLAYWLGGKALSYIKLHHLAEQIGWVRFDWQLVFLIFGIPGIVVALLMLLVKTPEVIKSSGSKFDLPAFKAFVFADNYRFLKMTIASALFNVAVYAAGVWLPTYLQRVHKMDVAHSGQILGIAMICIAPIGAIAGGVMGDRQNVSRGLTGRLSAIVLSIGAVLVCFILLGVELPVFAILLPLLALSLLMSAPVAITAAMIQEMSPEQMRSTAPAFMLMMQNLIGMSLGPASVAFLTEYVYHDTMMIGLSIAITGVVFCGLSMFLFYHIKRQAK
jgi:MFS family permease